MTWARETAEELDRPVSEMDPMIADKTRLLFGNDEQAIELRRPSIGGNTIAFLMRSHARLTLP